MWWTQGASSQHYQPRLVPRRTAPRCWAANDGEGKVVRSLRILDDELALQGVQLDSTAFTTVFAIGPIQLALYDALDHKALARLARSSAENAKSVGAYVEHGTAAGRGIRAADVAAGVHAALLHKLAAVPGARLELPPATYTQVRGGRGERGAPAERGSARVF